MTETGQAESRARVEVAEPAAVVERMVRHFAHKVAVERPGDGAALVALPAGRLGLTATAGGVALHAAATGEAGLGRVEQVAATHLARFARTPEPPAVAWLRPEPADPLERAARAWIAPYWNAHHLVRTRDWVRTLRPGAGDALRIAALTHDIERHFPGGPRIGERGAAWDDEAYLEEHCRRSAALVGAWLAERAAPAALRTAVEALVLAHERGGDPDADLLQAADSLSFLEVNGGLPRRWVREGRATVAQARAKLEWTAERIRVPEARELAGPYLRLALTGLPGEPAA